MCFHTRQAEVNAALETHYTGQAAKLHTFEVINAQWPPEALIDMKSRHREEDLSENSNRM